MQNAGLYPAHRYRNLKYSAVQGKSKIGSKFPSTTAVPGGKMNVDCMREQCQNRVLCPAGISLLTPSWVGQASPYRGATWAPSGC